MKFFDKNPSRIYIFLNLTKRNNILNLIRCAQYKATLAITKTLRRNLTKNYTRS